MSQKVSFLNLKSSDIFSFLIIFSLMFCLTNIEVKAATGTHQPVMIGYNVNDVLNWTPSSDPNSKYLRSRVPISSRIGSFTPTQAHTGLSYGAEVLTLSGDYDRDVKRPTKYGDENNKYLFKFWQYLDYYGAWHGLPIQGSDTQYGVINLPQPAYTDAAHRNGAKSLGCWFFPRTGQDVSQWIVKSGTSFPVADKLIEMAQYYGFDGYFINQESSTTSTNAAKLNEFLSYIRARGVYIQWYDSLLMSGSISYQNEFNNNNKAWVKNGTTDISNSIFCNYNFTSAKVQNGRNLAISMGLDPQKSVFTTLNTEEDRYTPRAEPQYIFPSGTPGGLTALGIFGSDHCGDTLSNERIYWSGPSQNPTSSGRNTAYPKWDGIAHYIPERSVIGSIPFVTRFNTGNGSAFYKNGVVSSSTPWYNASAQDILPTWQWWTESTGTPLTVDYDYTKAYNGGSSLKVSGTLSSSNATNLRLYKTDLNVIANTNLAITYYSASANTPTNAKVMLIFKDNPSAIEYLDIGNSTTIGWNTKSFNLSAYSGRAIATIGLRFEASNSVNYSINIGEIAVINNSTAPSAPTGFQIENQYFTSNTEAEMFLKWDMSASSVWYYDIFCLRNNGTREFLGRMYDEVYYVKSLLRNSETASTIELVAVGFNGVESSPATTAITWPSSTLPDTPTGLYATSASTSQINVTWNSSNGATGYDLMVDGAIVSNVKSPYSHTGLAANTTHTYQIRANNSYGSSNWSSQVSATTLNTTTSNLALNKTVTANSYVTGETPQKAVDGTTTNNSKWCSTTNIGAQWLTIDLGSNYNINRWVVKHAGAGGESSSFNTKDFKLQKSTDGTTWVDVDSVTGNTANITDRTVTAFNTRYLRLYITNPQTATNYKAARIYEIELYGN